MSWQDDLYNVAEVKRSERKVGVKGVIRLNKYNARQVVTEEGTFHSEKEYDRWCDLKWLEKVGHIHNLERQIPYRLEVNGHLIRKYTLDHRFVKDGKMVYEDVKGTYPRDWPMVKKLMLAVHGIEV